MFCRDVYLSVFSISDNLNLGFDLNTSFVVVVAAAICVVVFVIVIVLGLSSKRYHIGIMAQPILVELYVGLLDI